MGGRKIRTCLSCRHLQAWYGVFADAVEEGTSLCRCSKMGCAVPVTDRCTLWEEKREHKPV